MNKLITSAAVVLASVGAINWGLVKFVNVDVLTYVPSGIFSTVVVGLIAASGLYVLYELYSKRI